MRRFRTVPGDFDSRAADMAEPTSEPWDEQVRALHIENMARRWAKLVAEYGAWGAERTRLILAQGTARGFTRLPTSRRS